MKTLCNEPMQLARYAHGDRRASTTRCRTIMQALLDQLLLRLTCPNIAHVR